MFEMILIVHVVPYLILNFLLKATLVAAADQEPDKKQEEEQQQQSTDHSPDYDTRFIGGCNRRILSLTRGSHLISSLQTGAGSNTDDAEEK